MIRKGAKYHDKTETFAYETCSETGKENITAMNSIPKLLKENRTFVQLLNVNSIKNISTRLIYNEFDLYFAFVV